MPYFGLHLPTLQEATLPHKFTVILTFFSLTRCNPTEAPKTLLPHAMHAAVVGDAAENARILIVQAPQISQNTRPQRQNNPTTDSLTSPTHSLVSYKATTGLTHPPRL